MTPSRSTRIARLAGLLLTLGSVLTGCVTRPADWTKANVTAAERDRDFQACSSQARDQASSEYAIWRNFDAEMAKMFPDSSNYEAAVKEEKRREELTRSCMTAEGYSGG